ncbi:inorganic phosphate transporter [Arthrobacter sp. zg.Y20]|uniref:inorganic phosphate transporter n=1 Tax=unclassified Arthrobacter TaxID=235627 RepID=UPI0024C3C1FC|nr:MULTISPECIES: inorganic phosphate transporter [unclassified Arthrobacter]MDK1314822.1 inorganic phosphate transporter [Arthrobacter sp. zg.Y20]WIB04686.1 inorganic phosphate transporter [Arthrobacter sp. zg-Y20]
MDLTLMVALVIALALFFDFTNGFHDTANAMATPIATGAIKPKTAVALAAVLNLVGAFLSTEVAKTISHGLIREGDGGIQITPVMIFAGLMGAVIWNLITWLKGLPSSSSHALFGGLIGAAVVGAGFGSVDFSVLVSKVVLPALIAPVIAGFVAYLATKLAYRITRRHDPDSGEKLPRKRGGFRYAQIFSSSLVALAHGTNDAQKTMGVITLVLVADGLQTPGTGPHFWVVAACAVAIAAGTYAGGWRIIRTMGTGLTEVKPAQGFAAETSTAAAILASSHLGFALSTTQVASGSVIGSGLGRKGAVVRWGTAGRVASGWLLTLPAAAVMGAVTAAVASMGTAGVVIDAVVGTLVILGIFLWSRRDKVSHDNAVSNSGIENAGEVVSIKKRRGKGKNKGGKKAKQGKNHGKAKKSSKGRKNKNGKNTRKVKAGSK